MMDHKVLWWMFVIGVAIGVFTHIYLLTRGKPMTWNETVQHSIWNLFAMCLILISASQYVGKHRKYSEVEDSGESEDTDLSDKAQAVRKWADSFLKRE